MSAKRRVRTRYRTYRDTTRQAQAQNPEERIHLWPEDVWVALELATAQGAWRRDLLWFQAHKRK